MKSSLFDNRSLEYKAAGTPGFGPRGEGFFRLSAFNHRENVIAAVERIKNEFEVGIDEGGR